MNLFPVHYFQLYQAQFIKVFFLSWLIFCYFLQLMSLIFMITFINLILLIFTARKWNTLKAWNTCGQSFADKASFLVHLCIIQYFSSIHLVSHSFIQKYLLNAYYILGHWSIFTPPLVLWSNALLGLSSKTFYVSLLLLLAQHTLYIFKVSVKMSVLPFHEYSLSWSSSYEFSESTIIIACLLVCVCYQTVSWGVIWTLSYLQYGLSD